LHVAAVTGVDRTSTAHRSPPFCGRPLESKILDLSWRSYAQSTFRTLMSDSNPPVLAVYRRISHLLPLEFRAQAEPCLIFPPRAEQARYRRSTFVGGTETFKQKAAAAGLQACLSE
jgi:hypothetical protein